MDELGDKWAEFQIEDEEEGILFEETERLDDEVDARWCLVGKLLSDRPADFDALRNMMETLWRPGKGMFVKELDINRYLFQFFHEVDIQRVMEGSPWTFNKTPLLIERLQEGVNPRTLALNTMKIWVQVYDLKVGYMSEKVLKAAGDYIGKFVSSCPKNFTGIWRDYLRVRVLINMDKPLKRRMKISRSKEQWYWANFKYERVPTFCFICGVIGHSEKFCHKLFDEPLETIAKPYGLFMKAPERRNNRQIGARWLRDNMAQPLAGYSGEHTAEEGGLGAQDTGPKIKDTVMISGADQGGFMVKTGGRLGMIYGKSGSGFIADNIGAGNKEVIQNDGVTFIDPKRRRTQEVTDMGHILFIKDAGHEEFSNIGDSGKMQIELGHIKNKTVMGNEMETEATIEGSKNGLSAGAQLGARQES